MPREILHIPHGLDPALARVFQRLHDRLGQLQDSVNAIPNPGKVSDTQGKPGDIRLVRGADNKFYLQGRFKEGWVMSGQNVFQEGALSDVPPEFIASNTHVPGKVSIPINEEVGGSGLTHQQIMSRTFLGL